MMKDKIKNKIQLKQRAKSTRVNLPNLSQETEIIS